MAWILFPIIIKSAAPKNFSLSLFTNDNLLTVTLNLVIHESKYLIFLAPPKASRIS